MPAANGSRSRPGALEDRMVGRREGKLGISHAIAEALHLAQPADAVEIVQQVAIDVDEADVAGRIHKVFVPNFVE